MNCVIEYHSMNVIIEITTLDCKYALYFYIVPKSILMGYNRLGGGWDVPHAG